VKKWFAGLGRNINEGIQKILNDDLEEEKGKTLERLEGRLEGKRGKRIKYIEQL